MKKILYLPLIITFLLGTSCSDWLTIQPEDTLSKDEMFESKSGFYDALYGIYTLCDNNYGNNGNLISGTIEHFAAQWEVKTETDEARMRSHQYNLVDDALSSIFSSQYKVIADINLMLEYLETQNFLSQEDYNLLKGECLGLRAWLHFDLIRLWGPVPGHVNTGKEYLPYVTRFTKNLHSYHVYHEFMDLLLKDMNEAEELLENFPIEQNYRLNILGIQALKARIKLWQNDKQEALNYANKVLNFVKTFTTEDAEEQIYQLGTLNHIGRGDYAFGSEHLFGRYENFETDPFRSTLYNHTSYINELYESSVTDIRTKQWVDREVDGTDAPAMNLRKYTESASGSVPIIRLSEIYFIAMECGNLNQANELYEAFCSARGIATTSITGTQQLNTILQKEYRKEFIGEGVMFFYYKRNYTTKIPRNPDECTQACYVPPIPNKETDLN